MLATTTSVRGPLRGVSLVEPSSYLTDGTRLFRVLRGFSHPAVQSFALLEDCRTLEVAAFSPVELRALKLDVVREGPC